MITSAKKKNEDCGSWWRSYELLSGFCKLKGMVHSEFVPTGTTMTVCGMLNPGKAENTTSKVLSSHGAAFPST